MIRRTSRWLFALAPVVLLCSAMATRPTPVPDVTPTANICPICGGGWDDYWEFVATLVELDVAVARMVVGI